MKDTTIEEEFSVSLCSNVWDPDPLDPKLFGGPVSKSLFPSSISSIGLLVPSNRVTSLPEKFVMVWKKFAAGLPGLFA